MRGGYPRVLKRKVKVKNKYGLHARAAVTLVNEATKYESDIYLKRGDNQVNAKSILGIMILEAVKGTELELIVDGPDEKEAADAIAALFDRGFDEE